MKITIEKHVLFGPLDSVSKALPAKNVIPILSQILFQVDEDGLSLTAGDSKIFIKAIISADDFKLIHKGSIALPGKKITEIIRELKGEISIEVNEKLQATIKAGKTKFELSGMEFEDYPAFPEVNGQSFSLEVKSLKELVSKTIFATSSNSKETPILTGIYFQVSENQMKLTGCDRHRLGQVVEEIENGIDYSFVIDKDSIKDLLAIADGNEVVEMTIMPDRFLATTKGFVFFSRILEGVYPQVDKLIPINFKSIVTVRADKFIEAIGNANVIANEEKSNEIKITVGDEIEIESNVSGNKVSVSLEIIKNTGEGFKVSVNANFILDALKSFDSKNALIQFVADMSPIVLKGEDEDYNTQLVLPYLDKSGVKKNESK